MNIPEILRSAFAGRDFTAREAALVLGLSRVSGTLSRLKSDGIIEGAGRARYRIAAPEAAARVNKALLARRIAALLEGPARVALDGPDAVAAWTKGRYTGGTPVGRHLVHLACAARDRDLLAAVLDEMAIPWAEGDAWPAGRGLLARVRFVPRLSRVRRGGAWVIPRKETERIIRDNPAAYEGALEWF